MFQPPCLEIYFLWILPAFIALSTLNNLVLNYRKFYKVVKIIFKNICSFYRYLSSVYYVPGMVLGPWDPRKWDKTHMPSILMFTVLWGENFNHNMIVRKDTK